MFDNAARVSARYALFQTDLVQCFQTLLYNYNFSLESECVRNLYFVFAEESLRGDLRPSFRSNFPIPVGPLRSPYVVRPDRKLFPIETSRNNRVIGQAAPAAYIERPDRDQERAF